MFLRLVVPILLALAAYSLLPRDQRLLILLELDSPELGLGRLEALGSIRYHLQVGRNIDGHMAHVDTSTKEKYNYALVTNSFSGEEEAQSFGDSLKKLDFVKNCEIFPFASLETRRRLANFIIYIKSVLPPLRAQLTPLQKEEGSMKELGGQLCSQEARREQGAMVVINIMKVKDQEAADKYGAACFDFFTATGTRLFMIGKPSSEYWDQIGLVEYASREGFCQMAQSEEWGAVHHYKVEGYADTHTYITKQLL